MYFLKKHLFVLTALLLCSMPIAAQDKASIVGTVTDATGAAVPGAQVELKNPATGKSYRVLTSGNGVQLRGTVAGMLDVFMETISNKKQII